MVGIELEAMEEIHSPAYIEELEAISILSGQVPSQVLHSNVAEDFYDIYLRSPVPGKMLIVAMSKEVCHKLKIKYNPSIILNMQSANSCLDPSLGLARNVLVVWLVFDINTQVLTRGTNNFCYILLHTLINLSIETDKELRYLTSSLAAQLTLQTLPIIEAPAGQPTPIFNAHNVPHIMLRPPRQSDGCRLAHIPHPHTIFPLETVNAAGAETLFTKIKGMQTKKKYEPVAQKIFIKDFTHRAHNLVKLTGKDQPFKFGPEQQEAQIDIVNALEATKPLVPVNYQSDNPVILAIDTSDIAVSFYTCQIDKTTLACHVYCRFGSITLNTCKSHFLQLKLELYSVFRALGAFRLYIIGVRNLILEVNACYIKGMLSNPDILPSASINRWITAILMFDFKLVHIKGTHHRLDGLSRQPPQPGDPELTEEEEYGFMHIIQPCIPPHPPLPIVEIFAGAQISSEEEDDDRETDKAKGRLLPTHGDLVHCNPP
ncbi:hypothetical protein H0H81_000248 [Sphagnurus paluster]|uniref:Reverse transcriptase/retrotransposon-derived protein RNase H-like domain-containing protein n=1 Tax=Sphagnurus paluster TaxID=117069 RepID=A0A9P7K338_9AGAR|nr:hypothetical protein H0H81_000248 [Sphagnurus paluster]